MAETLDWLRHLEEVATSMYSVGGGRQSDVLRAGVEVARMRPTSPACRRCARPPPRA
jgi:outer membrane protein TolC